MKKLLSLTLVLALALGLCIPALAVEDAPVDGDAEASYLPGGIHMISLEEDYYEVDVDDLEVMDPDLVDDALTADGGWSEIIDESLLGDIIQLPDPNEPTLTLVVNGVASDAVLTVEDWVTYLDAADARAILGATAVSPTLQGPVALRQAAEAAGWEVVWYDGGWTGWQEICLWNKAAVIAQLDAKFGPFQNFIKTYMDLCLAEFNSPTAKKSTEIITGTLTRFSTLDGNKDGVFRLRAESVWQAGVMDVTLHMDLSGIVDLLSDGEVALLGHAAGLDRAGLKTLLSQLKAEVVVDVNTGGAAFNADAFRPLLPELSGWQVSYTPTLGEDLAQTAGFSLSEMLYDSMLDGASYAGGILARTSMDATVSVLEPFLGAERFHTVSDGSWTYTLTTDQVNGILNQFLAAALADGESAPSVEWFKKCDITLHLDRTGKMDMTMDFRTNSDADDQLKAILGFDLYEFFAWNLPDLAIKGHAAGDLRQSEGTMELHWNNHGKVKLTTETTSGNSGTGPRQVVDLERQTVYDHLGRD